MLTCYCIHLLTVKLFKDKLRADPCNTQPRQEHCQQHTAPLGLSPHSFYHMSDWEESRMQV